MAETHDTPAGPAWSRRILALGLATAVVGLPVNDLPSFGLLLLAAVLLFSGTVAAAPLRWLVAIAVAGIAVTGRLLLPLPQIEEGHNIVLGDGEHPAIAAALPAGAAAFMQAEFRATYPPERWCDATRFGCWRRSAPLPAFGFSADGLHTAPAWSRRVTGIDFSNGMALRLGFVNDWLFNWYGDQGGVERAIRDRRSVAIFGRWTMLLPYFVMYRLPAEHVGSSLCWRGTVLWEGGDGGISVLRNLAMACRTLQPEDAGRRIVGVSIDQKQSLAMTLHANAAVAWRALLHAALTILGVAGVLVCLVRWQRGRSLPAFLLTTLVLGYVVAIDVTMLGWLRPFDTGDDGIAHMGYGRLIAQALHQGEIMRALEGGEPIYFFVPGFRYVRALEQFLFGDTVLGTVAALVATPFVVLAAARRFLPGRWAVAFLLLFMATPVGALFGTNFANHARWAAKGFGEPLAATLLLGGLALLIAIPHERARVTSAGANFCAALLLALAVFIRPNLMVMGGVILAGAGIILLRQARILPAAALAAGFAPVALMPLHNWVFGKALVLFTKGETTYNFATAPSAYPRALRELLTFDFGGSNLAAVARQLRWFLSGPSELAVMIPMHLAALAILVRVLLTARFDGWLRIVALATLLQCSTGLFYQHHDRYHLLTWLLTGLVTMAWLRAEGLDAFARRWPNAARAISEHPLIARISRWIDRCLPSAGAAQRS